jgi:Helicase associated domain
MMMMMMRTMVMAENTTEQQLRTTAAGAATLTRSVVASSTLPCLAVSSYYFSTTASEKRKTQRRQRIRSGETTESTASPTPETKQANSKQGKKWEERFARMQKLVKEKPPQRKIRIGRRKQQRGPDGEIYFKTSAYDYSYRIENDRVLSDWWKQQKALFERQRAGHPLRSASEQRLKRLREVLPNVLFPNEDGPGRGAVVAPPRTWEDRYGELCDYVREHGGTFPNDNAASTEKERRLRRWCNLQRTLYWRVQANKIGSDRMTITPERIEQLDRIDFPWTHKAMIWGRKYQKLAEFHALHGHSLIPLSDPELGRWIDTNRNHYVRYMGGRPSNMTAHRIELLNRIDFAWNGDDARWLLRFRDLQEALIRAGVASEEGGTSNSSGGTSKNNNNTKNMQIWSVVRRAGHKSLRLWLTRQMGMYHKLRAGRRSTLTPERQKLLECLGVVFPAAAAAVTAATMEADEEVEE